MRERERERSGDNARRIILIPRNKCCTAVDPTHTPGRWLPCILITTLPLLWFNQSTLHLSPSVTTATTTTITNDGRYARSSRSISETFHFTTVRFTAFCTYPIMTYNPPPEGWNDNMALYKYPLSAKQHSRLYGYERKVLTRNNVIMS